MEFVNTCNKKLRHKKFQKIQFKFFQCWNYTPFWCSRLPNLTLFWSPRQPNFTPFPCPRQPNFSSFRCPQQTKGSPPPTEEHWGTQHNRKSTTILYIVHCTIYTVNCTLSRAFFFRRLPPNLPMKLFHQIFPLNLSTQSFYPIFPPNFPLNLSANLNKKQFYHQTFLPIFPLNFSTQFINLILR